MPQTESFVPIFIVAVLSLIVLLVVFGGGFIAYSPLGRLPPSKTIILGNDFTVTYTLGEETVAELGGEVSRGIFSAADKRFEFDVSNLGDISEGLIKLRLWNSNYYGNLLIIINDEIVYRGAPEIGDHSISFDASILNNRNILEVKSETSGWRIWAPTIYIFDLSVDVSYAGRKTQSFGFDLTNLETVNVNRARLLVFGTREGTGKLTVKLNNQEIYEGYTAIYTDFSVDNLKVGTNTLDLSTEPNTRYNISSAEVVLFFG